MKKLRRNNLYRQPVHPAMATTLIEKELKESPSYFVDPLGHLKTKPLVSFPLIFIPR
jgi:hypothetical protein